MSKLLKIFFLTVALVISFGAGQLFQRLVSIEDAMIYKLDKWSSGSQHNAVLAKDFIETCLEKKMLSREEQKNITENLSFEECARKVGGTELASVIKDAYTINTSNIWPLSLFLGE